MPECRYCGAAFDDEDSHRAHLLSDHAAELGPIDRRRLQTEETSLADRIPVALIAVIGIAVAVVGFVLLSAGGSGGAAGGQGPVGSTHVHGTLVVLIDGERVDFSAPEYQYPRAGTDAFHFEGGNGRVYHVHATGVTLESAMEALGFTVTETSLTVDGTTYRDTDPGTTVEITVNGQAVDPASYVLQGVTDASRATQGDTIRITVTTT